IGRRRAAHRAVRPRGHRAGSERLDPRGGPHPLPGHRPGVEGPARAAALGLPPACVMDHLEGKVAVVTGAASGIGRAMADCFAAEGMRVALADIERPALERTVGEMTAGGFDVLAVPTDVSVAAEVHALAATTLEHHGDVHLVCNNAGVGSRGLPIPQLPAADFASGIPVSLFGVSHGLQAFLPRLRANDEGHLVNTASASGLVHLPRMGPYNASKAAVVALSETLRFELEAEGSHVGVSVLCPSWTRTNISTS